MQLSWGKMNEREREKGVQLCAFLIEKWGDKFSIK
jgi:hypothetical protein